jgi:ABC-type transport system involved in multi-copper enzyme maturation permease subunit
MRQFLTISINAFMELVRQPVFLLLMTGSLAFEIFLAVPYYFAFGDEPKLVENSVLAVMLLSGLFGAVLSASSSLAREIRSGTALVVLSKPVGRVQFLLAKFTGLAIALTVLTYVNMIGVLLASRMAFDAYGKTDLPAIGIVPAGFCWPICWAGSAISFCAATFVSDAVFGVVALTTFAAFVVFQFTKQMESLGTLAHVNWNLLPAGILILFAPCGFWRRWRWRVRPGSTPSRRWRSVPAIFLIGLDVGLFLRPGGCPRFLVGFDALQCHAKLAAFLARRRDQLGKSTFHWDYVAKALGYAVCYAGAALAARGDVLLRNESWAYLKNAN